MFEEPIVSFEASEGFSLIGADLIVDEEDFPGVHIAVDDLAQDFGRVTGQGGNIKVDGNAPKTAARNCILVGTLEKSPSIRTLKEAGRIETGKLESKWESWMTVCLTDPFKGYSNGLVVVGSDKRGAIYGTYSLSEQIGGLA
jgi:hypothetical protein